jgi:hypothetical protein
MEKSNKRGKIPQSDWPLIMARYDAGETLASIARTYDCSPPAISYVVSRSRARQPGPPKSVKPVIPPEPQLIKTVSGETGNAPPSAAPPTPAAAVAAATEVAGGDGNPRNGEAQRTDNGGLRDSGDGVSAGAPQRSAASAWQRPAAAAPANGDHRRTLHLSLGAPAHGNGGAPVPEPPVAERPSPVYQPPLATAAPEPGGNGAGAASPAVAGAQRPGGLPHHNGGDAAPRREGGAFIDRELRARVEGDIAAFLAAFDGALDQDTLESRAALREATDRLLRAGARTRIELERLEARLPLLPRDAARGGHPVWRDR